jgi:hypothetical protein
MRLASRLLGIVIAAAVAWPTAANDVRVKDLGRLVVGQFEIVCPTNGRGANAAPPTPIGQPY